MSPGWHCRCSQMASSVEKRMAFALPVLSTERFWAVMSTPSARSFRRILRWARTTSRLTMMGILNGRMNVECRMQKRNPARQLDCFIIHHSAFFLCVLDRQFLFLLNLPALVHDPGD